MALSREQIVQAAVEILRTYGLADLTMRRLARELGVQPGALYWHVANKQELLGAVASHLFDALQDLPAPSGPAPTGPAPSGPALPDPAAARRLAHDVRSTLLGVRDGAEVAVLAYALNPDTLAPVERLQTILETEGATAQQARWGARALAHYILGSVATEQARAELCAAGLAESRPDPPTDDPDDPDDEANQSFTFGVDVVLTGLHGQYGITVDQPPSPPAQKRP